MKISGCVILYNPEKDVIENIKSYIDYIDKLFVFDNSDKPNTSFFNDLISLSDKIIYLSEKQNLGIAKALNICADKSLSEDFDWLLTMDQDSKFDKISNLSEIMESVDQKNIGIVASSVLKKFDTKDIGLTDKYTDINWAITSGSLLNLKIYREIGSFLDDLFIDEVDYEYCLRIKKNNYSIIKHDNLILNHNLGDITTHKFLFMNFKTCNHSPIRKYYITRNRMYVSLIHKNEFPNIAKGKIIANIKDSIKVLLFENNKKSKIYHIFLGYMDYRKNKLGKFHKHI